MRTFGPLSDAAKAREQIKASGRRISGPARQICDELQVQAEQTIEPETVEAEPEPERAVEEQEMELV